MLCLYITASSTEWSSPRKRDSMEPGEAAKKRRKTHEPSFEMEVDPSPVPVLEDFDVDLMNHLEVNGAAVRVPEERITLQDEVVYDLQLRAESQDFGEISGLDLERYVLSHDGEETVPVPQEQPPARDESPVPVPEIEQLPRTCVETEMYPAVPTESQIPVTVTSPDHDQHPSSEPPIPAVQTPPAVPSPPPAESTPAVPQTPAIQPALAVSPSPAIQPAPAVSPTPDIQPAPAVSPTPDIQPAPAVPQTPAPHPPLPRIPTTPIGQISDPPLILDQVVQVSPRRRRRWRRRVPFQDKQTQISLHDMTEKLHSWEDTLRVQVATADQLNIEKQRYIIPAEKLLESVRNAILPDRLKNLFSRHMHTHGMPDESLAEVSVFREAESSSFSLSSLRAENLQLSQSGRSSRLERSIGVPQVLETITEGTEADADIRQLQQDALAEGILEIPQIIVQEVPVPELPPEEVFAVHPQEPTMRAVPLVEQMARPERSEKQLELDAEAMLRKLRPLWDAGSPVTFSLICPPSSTDMITALMTFELLLNMDHLGMICLMQNLHNCPPTLPREPIIIHPVQ